MESKLQKILMVLGLVIGFAICSSVPVDSQIGYRPKVLNDLRDVNAGSPSDNDALTWDNATSMWIPEAIAGVDESASYTWTGTHDFTGATVSLDTVTWTGTHDFSGSTFTVPSSFTSGTDTIDFATGAAEDEILTYNAVTTTWGSEPAAAGVTIGTLNTIAKFAAADLADSLLTDDGSAVSLTAGSGGFKLADGSTTDDAIIFGAGDDASMYWNGSQLEIDMDKAAGAFRVELYAASSGTWRFDAINNGNFFGGAMMNAANASFNFVELEVDNISNVNGSDELNILLIDFNEAGATHAGAGNTLNAINIDNITAEANITENIFFLGDGFEYLINDVTDTALGTLTWTTNADKDANTASGTLKVFINNTLYHIQLYADS